MQPWIVRPPVGDNRPEARLYYGVNVIEGLKLLGDNSVHMVATSPPYWGLRDYGVEGVVWGGNPDCDHEWGAKLPPDHPGQVEQTGRKLGSCSAISPPPKGSNTKRSSVDKAGNAGAGRFCTRCDAWKGQLGLEPTPDLYVQHMVEVFRGVKRVLRSDGTLWLNLGDSYSGGGGYSPGSPSNQNRKSTDRFHGNLLDVSNARVKPRPGWVPPGLKPKDLVGIPWRVALALQADGWYIRSDIVWAKPNPMPESVRDRPTKAHEYVFLFAHPDSGGRYFYDRDAVREAGSPASEARYEYEWGGKKAENLLDQQVGIRTHPGGPRPFRPGRNKRTVWTITTKPYPGAHFAVWPPDLVEPMVKAGTSHKGVCPHCGAPWERVVEKTRVLKGNSARAGRSLEEMQASGKWVQDRSTGNLNLAGGPAIRTKTLGWQPVCTCPDHTPVRATVLDPFSGSATTGHVALKLGRNYVGLDLNADYVRMAEARILGERAPRADTDEPVEGSILDLFGA